MLRVLFTLVIGLLGSAVPAAAASVTFYNCSATTFHLKIYNQADRLCLVPRVTPTLPRCGTVTLECDGTCQVQGFDGIGAFERYPSACGSLVMLGAGPHLISKRLDVTIPQSVDVWRGTVHWGDVCACSEAELPW
jgi:hypothetical protein